MLTGSVVKGEVLPTSPAPRRSLRPDGPEVGFVNAAVASARAPCCLDCLPAARQGGLRAPMVSSAVPPPPSEHLWSARLSPGPPPSVVSLACFLLRSVEFVPVCRYRSAALPADDAPVTARSGPAAPCLMRHWSWQGAWHGTGGR